MNDYPYYWEQKTKTAPVWIIGVNGFAVDVLSQKTGWLNYSEDQHKTPEGQNLWNIDGYDVCNSMMTIDANTINDVIKLLRSDGSVLELRNSIGYTNSSTEPQLLIGTYYENSINPNGYAIVDYIVEHTPGPRIVKYYPGDGLEYVFKEVCNSDRFPYYGNWQLPTPNMFYLTQINSSLRKLTDFKREWHNFEGAGVENYSTKHSHIVSFADQKYTYTKNSLNITSLDRTLKINLMTINTDISSDGKDEVNKRIVESAKGKEDAFSDFQDEICNDYYYKEYWLQGNESQIDENKLFGDYNQGYQYLVKDIFDPMDRKTSFAYSFIENNYVYDINGSPIYNTGIYDKSILLLNSITEPTKKYELSYDTYDYGWNMPETYKYLSLYYRAGLSQLKEFEIIPNKRNEDKLIKTQTYSIEILDGATRETTIETYNFKEPYIDPDISAKYIFKKVETDALLFNDYTPNLSQLMLDSTEIRIKNGSSYNLQTSKTNYVELWKEAESFPCIFPINEVTYVDYVKTGKNTFEYEYVQNTNANVSDIIKKATLKVQKKTTRTFNPLTNALMFKEVSNFKHLDLDYSTIQDTCLNSFMTYVNNLNSLKSDNPSLGFTYEVNQNIKAILPPINNILESTFIYDVVDNLIGKKEYFYNETDLQNTATHYGRRGALLYEIATGRDGVATRTDYSYRGGNFRNLLTETTIDENPNTKSKSYYFFKDLPRDASLFGKKLDYNNGITNAELFKFEPDCETPLASESFVRKVDNDGVVYNETFRTYNERTKYGQVSSVIDANGWISEKKYDKNGRALFEIAPYDFMPNPMDLTSDVITEQLSAVTTVIRSVSRKIIPGSSSVLFDNNTFIANTEVPNLINNSLSINIYNDPNLISVENAIKIEVENTANSIINTPHPYDYAYLNLNFLGFSKNEQATITINANGHRYAIIELGRDYTNSINICKSSDNKNISLLISDLLKEAQENGTGIVFTIQINNSNSKVYLSAISEDLGASISIIPTDYAIETLDFTTQYLYDDYNRSITKLSKIDDIQHTSNKDNWNTIHGYYGRYAESEDAYGANNRLIKSSYLSSAYGQVRSFLSGFANENGYLQSSATDVDGNKVTSFSDASGRLIKKEFQEADPAKPAIVLGETLVDEIIDVRNVQNLPLGAQDMDFFGFARRVRSDNKQFIVDSYFDAMGNLRYQVKNPGADEIITKYSYDVYGNLNWVINPKGDTIRYWYYPNGKLRYSYQQDVGFSSFKYDKYGRLRFSQNQLQAESNKISFFEYDDMGRTTNTGEAIIDISNMTIAPITYDVNGVLTGAYKKRITDYLDSNLVHYTSVPNKNTPTLNPTIFSNVSPNIHNIDVPFPSMVDIFPIPRNGHWDNIKDSYCPIGTNYGVPSNGVLNNSFFLQPYLKPIYGACPISSVNNFEDFVLYPENLRTAVLYDAFPDLLMGELWKEAPSKYQIKKLNNNRDLQNLKGRQAVIAYRDAYDESLNYSFFSYDARGRVESLIRYSRKFGFDAVYYSYNSANKVIKVRTADPLRQRVTWYEYDELGRSIASYTAIGDDGSGLGYNTANNNSSANLHYPINEPDKPSIADATYEYNRKGAVNKIYFPKIQIAETFDFSPMGLTKKISAIKDLNNQVIYSQELTRKDNGLIEKEELKVENEIVSNNFAYDGVSRISSWTRNDNQKTPILLDSKSAYNFDKLGNILSFARGGKTVSYKYSSTKPNQLYGFENGVKTFDFEYYSNGAVSSVTKHLKDRNDYYKRDEFGYTPGGMVKTLTSSWHDGIKADHITLGVFDTTITMRYRYNPQGARESKWQDIVKFDYLKVLNLNHGDIPIDLEYTDANGAYIYEMVPNGYWDKFTYKLPTIGRIYDGIVNQYGAAGERYTEYYGRHVDNSVVYFAAVYSLESGAIQKYRDDGRTEYAIRDHLGSARFIIVQDANNFVTYNKPDYDPYGEKLITPTKPAVKTLDAYNGSDAESDYTAMGARWYLPEIGRFLSCDPLWAAFPSMSPYVYANNNPMSFKDPTGMAPEKEEGETKKSSGKKSGNKTLTVAPYFGLSADVIADLSARHNSSYEGGYVQSDYSRTFEQWFCGNSFDITLLWEARLNAGLGILSGEPIKVPEPARTGSSSDPKSPNQSGTNGQGGTVAKSATPCSFDKNVNDVSNLLNATTKTKLVELHKEFQELQATLATTRQASEWFISISTNSDGTQGVNVQKGDPQTYDEIIKNDGLKYSVNFEYIDIPAGNKKLFTGEWIAFGHFHSNNYASPKRDSGIKILGGDSGFTLTGQPSWTDGNSANQGMNYFVMSGKDLVHPTFYSYNYLHKYSERTLP